MKKRFDRQVRFFGREGQERLAATQVAVGGIGGLGTHVVQQLALLGVGRFALIDSEELAVTDRNRYVGARHDDSIPGTPKVDIGERIIHPIDPTIEVEKIQDSLVSERGFRAVMDASHVFGCLDSEGARLILNELCAAYARPYFDLASDIVAGNSPSYGGRVCVAWEGRGCLTCLNCLDVREAQIDLAGPAARRERDTLYGVATAALNSIGPSVVSINGVVASLGVTEFLLAVTGVRAPRRLSTYYGHTGKVVVSTNEPAPGCYYCTGIRGGGDAVGLHRYLTEGLGSFALGRGPRIISTSEHE